MTRRNIPHAWLFGFLLTLLPGLTPLPAHAQPPAVFSAVEAFTTVQPAQQAGASAPASGPTVLRRRLVTIDLAQLATARVTMEEVAEAGEAATSHSVTQAARLAAPPSLSLNLFADAVFPAHVAYVETTRSGGYVLAGHLDGQPLSTFTLVVNGDTVAGTVLTPWDSYQIHTPPAPTGGYEIRQVDLSSLPPEGELPTLPPASERASAPASLPAEEAGANSSGPTIIDIAVFYTPTAKKKWGGTARAETQIDLFVADTNKAFTDSDVNQRIRLVHRGEVEYTETDKYTDWLRLWLPSDGHLDEIHTIRTQVGADLVAFIVEKPGDSCGRGAVNDPFSVMGSGCGSLTFAHELGHNLGLNHDRTSTPNSTTPSPPPATDRPVTECSFGYVNQRVLDEQNPPTSAHWQTIMANGAQCLFWSCPVLLRFSNARQQHNGDRLGIPCLATESTPASARETLNHTAGTVAGWRAKVEAPLFLTTLLNPDRTYTKYVVVPALLLPEASAGDGPLTYSLSPALPAGLSFDATTRTIQGTPTATAVKTTYTYTATDPEDNDTASLTFTLTVVESAQDFCDADDPAVAGYETSLVADCYTLLGLKDTLRGNSTQSLNWDKELDMGGWDGVTVSDSRVTALNLRSKGLAGSLTTALASLTGLTTLDLSYNQLTGTIPDLKNLSSLTTLDVSDNSLSGAIPDLSSLSSLTYLDLSYNQLTGQIPFRAGTSPLTTLTTFYTTSNDTLCLPPALTQWHKGLAEKKKDFLVLCLPNPDLTFIQGVPIPRVTVVFVGGRIRSLGNPPILPAGLSEEVPIDNDKIELSGTPSETQGPTPLSYTITSTLGYTVRFVLTITVEADTAPDLTGKSVGAQTYTQGSAVSVTLPASTTGNRPLTYRLTPALPAGLSFSEDTRLLSGTPHRHSPADELHL